MDELDELRLKIAKAKGYPASVWSIHKWTDTHDALEFDYRPCTMGAEVMYPDDRGDCPGLEMFVDGAWISVPDWPRSIAAAWELITEAEGAGVGFDLCDVVYTQPSNVYFYEATFFDPIGGPNSKRYEARCSTVPEAICRAWLAWKEGKA